MRFPEAPAQRAAFRSAQAGSGTTRSSAIGPDLPAWMAPHKFVALVVLPLAVFVVAASTQEMSTESGYSVTSLVTPESILMLFIGLGTLTFGSFLVSSHVRPPQKSSVPSTASLDLLFALCLLGYTVWFLPLLIQSPGTLIAAMRGDFGAVYEVRWLAPNITGITTLTQFGVSYALIYSDLRFRAQTTLPRRYDTFFWTIIAFATLRALANSERIALIEVGLPSLFVYFASFRSVKTPKYRLLRKFFPLVLVVIAPIFFVVFEYNRSWVNHYQYRYDNIFSFGLERISIYYSSSFNNMAGYLQYTDWPTWNGFNTFLWLYKFPVFGNLMAEYLDPKTLTFPQFLELYASEEFNNQTGVLPAFQDWGMIGAGFYFFFMGMFYGYCYICFANRQGWFRHVYPVILFALFEILRIDYFVDGRSVAVMIGLLLAWMLQLPVSSRTAPVRALGRAR